MKTELTSLTHQRTDALASCIRVFDQGLFPDPLCGGGLLASVCGRRRGFGGWYWPRFSVAGLACWALLIAGWLVEACSFLVISVQAPAKLVLSSTSRAKLRQEVWADVKKHED